MTDSIPFFETADGGRFPSVGLGTWKIPSTIMPEVLVDAASIGYRHFDCACDYGNEKAVGEGLRRVMSDGLCKREDLWITSKLWNTYHHPDHVRAACERTLRDLELDELDLYLIHFPVTLAYVPFEERYPPGWFFDPDAEKPEMKHVPIPLSDTWGAMERLVSAGLVKRIGVCNFSTSLLRDLLSYSSLPPQVLQVEMHPFLTQQRLLRYCHEQGIVVTAFSPFGASSYVPLHMADESESVLIHPTITEMAKTHGKTAGQILLRWAVQRGTVPIPKSQSPEHLRENLSLFDFELGVEEVAAIDVLDRGRRFNDPAEFCERAFHTFYPIFD